MGNIFGKSKKMANITQNDRIILQVKQQRDKIKQYQKKLALQLDNEISMVKKLVNSGQKDKALLLLKKKKYTEKVLQRTDNELMNIENLITDIEFKNVEQSVLKGLELGNEALKNLNAVFSIDKIEALLEETEEGVKKQQEISDMISNLVGVESSEEELDQELADILDVKVSLPEAPNEELVTPESKGKKETRIQKEKIAIEA